MTLAARREALTLAEQAHTLVQSDPFRARVLAEKALTEARAEHDRESQVAALHALGIARWRLGDPRALPTIREAVRFGERNGFVHRAALARRNLALYLAYRGKTERAMAEIDAAQAALSGIDRARSEVFRIAVYHLAGRLTAVLPASDAALRVLRRRHDIVWEARLAYNRGAALSEIGEVGRARRDLERASRSYSTLGLSAAAADARIELARLRSMEGDPVACLAELDAVDADALSDWAACWLHLNRAEAFLALRLLPEARADLERFEATSARVKAADSVNKARLEAARLSLLAGDADGAIALATTARRSFAAHHQRPNAAAATVVALSAAIARGAVSRSTVRAGRRAADDLEADGRTLEALRAHLLLGHAAVVAGTSSAAKLELTTARSLERRGTVEDRIDLRHVEALDLLRDHDSRRAERKLRDGLELLEEHRATLGAAELRATTSALGVELARQGLRIALNADEPALVLDWAERLRANALRLPSVRPPSDQRLRSELVELRRLGRIIESEQGAGRSTRALTARRSELEASVRARARLGRGARNGRSLPVGGHARRLGRSDHAVVEFIEADGRLKAATLAGDSLILHELGDVEISTDLDWLRFALRRLSRGGLDGRGRATTLASARAAADALDSRLFTPMRDAIGTAPLVIVPTGPLHAVPWGALPSLRGRPLAVAPSLSTWLDLARRPRQRRRTTALVAGPGLRHARAEIHGVGELIPEATVLTGKAATVEATLAALDGATLAHVACHGRFRADSPLFSSLELADGPLTALDIQGLRRAPDVLVLSACDVALSERHPGDELLGLSAALLASGTRTIVASVVPVPDAAARRLMLAFHRRLAAGESPAAALAGAQAGLRADRSALAGFLCLGVG